MLVSWQRILIRNQLNASNASDSQNNTIVAATGVLNLRLTVSLVRFRQENHLVMFGQESYLVRFMKQWHLGHRWHLFSHGWQSFDSLCQPSTSSTCLWRWHLTSSFTTVIINRLARGFHHTRNVNTGRNNLLLLRTCGSFWWGWAVSRLGLKGASSKAQLFTTHDHAIGNSFILA